MFVLLHLNIDTMYYQNVASVTLALTHSSSPVQFYATRTHSAALRTPIFRWALGDVRVLSLCVAVIANILARLYYYLCEVSEDVFL